MLFGLFQGARLKETVANSIEIHPKNWNFDKKSVKIDRIQEIFSTLGWQSVYNKTASWDLLGWDRSVRMDKVKKTIRQVSAQKKIQSLPQLQQSIASRKSIEEQKTEFPIEALFLCTWGITPGKYFLRMQFRQGRRAKLDFITALRRSVNVWFRGLGMMIPIINCICLVFAYYRLKTFQLTSWDRDEHIKVSHLPVEKWRTGLAALLIASAMLFHTISRFL